MSAETARQQLWEQLLNGMEGFLATWQSTSKASLSAEQLTQIYRLVAIWHWQDRSPKNYSDCGRRIGPLLCNDPQERFLFDRTWQKYWGSQGKVFSRQSTRAKEGLEKHADIHKTSLDNWHDQFSKKVIKRYKIVAIVFLFIAASIAALTAWQFWPSPSVVETKAREDVVRDKNIPINGDTGIVPRPKSNKPYLQSIPLRQPAPKITAGVAEREKLEFMRYAVIGSAFALVALGCWGYWWASRVRFEIRRGAQRTDELHYKVATPNIDSELIPGFNRILARLRFAPSGVDKIHWPDTVRATARQGGYPILRSRQRHRQIDYVVITDSRHLQDQASWLMRRLAETLRNAHIRVHYYDFDRHPEWLWSQGQRNQKPMAFEDIVLRHADSRLLVVVDHEMLFYRLTGDAQSWLKQLWHHPEYRLALLTQPNAQQHKQLEMGGYPFNVLNEQTDLSALLNIASRPNELQYNAQDGFDRDWLSDIEPEDLDVPLAWLSKTLDADGMRLLRAMALYPRLYGDLSFALFQWLNEAENKSPPRPSTLIKIVTLLWCRQGWFPQWLRQALLKSQSTQDYRHFCRFFQHLFDRDQAFGSRTLQLDVAKPPSVWGAFWARKLVNRATIDSPLYDQIFAKVLLAPRRRLGEMLLPRRLLQALPKAALSKWMPTLILSIFAVGVLAMASMVWERFGSELFSEAKGTGNSNWEQRDLEKSLRYATDLLSVTQAEQKILCVRIKAEADWRSSFRNRLNYAFSMVWIPDCGTEFEALTLLSRLTADTDNYSVKQLLEVISALLGRIILTEIVYIKKHENDLKELSQEALQLRQDYKEYKQQLGSEWFSEAKGTGNNEKEQSDLRKSLRYATDLLSVTQAEQKIVCERNKVEAYRRYSFRSRLNYAFSMVLIPDCGTDIEALNLLSELTADTDNYSVRQLLEVISTLLDRKIRIPYKIQGNRQARKNMQ